MTAPRGIGRHYGSPRRMGDGMTVLKSNGRVEYWVWRHGRLVRVPGVFERAAWTATLLLTIAGVAALLLRFH